ncbi:MAG: hypothetical protein H0T89_19230 [Deltaproteobacteria bacterium]|nr:hypothetical protein [Deltaproteobacteria bacterium]MDQ3296715.1 hypothetical protein [Myxococcota bacterium]
MYADTSRVAEAREQYFVANKFSDASYRDRWVKFKVGPIPIAFLNTPSRKLAIPLHDLHHVATEYDTTLVGEAEIGAWEIAGGCGRYWAAWYLNATTFAAGLVIAPRRTYRAFIRGRHSRPLYWTGWSDDLVSLTVGELRTRIALPREAPSPTWRDRAAFAGWVGLVAMPGLGALTLAAKMLR